MALLLAAPASASANCTLSLLLVECLEATFPSAASLGSAIDAGTTATSATQSVVVSSNQPWGLRIQSDHATGRLREHTGAAYVASPRTTANPLQWGLISIDGVPQTTVWTSLTSTATAIVSNRPATSCVLGGLCGDDTIGVRLRLTTSYADRRVAPNSYRVLVTYTASHGF